MNREEARNMPNSNYLNFPEEIDLEQNAKQVSADRKLFGSGRLLASNRNNSNVSDQVGSKDDFKKTLLEMNFQLAHVEAVLVDVDEGDSRDKIIFKYFIKKENDVWDHSFREPRAGSNILVNQCIYCGDTAENHTNYIACQVCFSSNATLTKLECGHQFCISCIESYFKFSLDSGKLARIPCLEESCEKQITTNDINLLSDKNLVEKILKLREIQLVNMDPDIKWCPGASCTNYYKISEEAKKGPLLICKDCQTRICTRCGRAEHKKKWYFFKNSCEEELNEEYERWAKGKAVQNCPKCGTKVEKDDGCNHMTCFVCNYNWCWLCRGRYSQNHYSQLNVFGCPGLGSANNTMERYPKWRIYLLRFGMGLLVILIVVLAIILGPLVLIGFVTKNVASAVMKILRIPHDISSVRGSFRCLKYTCLIFINIIFITLCLPFGLALTIACLPFILFNNKIRQWVFS